MKSKGLIVSLSSFIFLSLLNLVSADISVPLSMLTIPFIPIIIFIEGFIIWILINKSLKIQLGFWKSILIAFTANIVTSLIGTFIPLYRYVTENLTWVAIAFVLSVLIEWAIYTPFLRKFEIKKLDLLMISFIANVATYIPLAIIITLK